MVIYASIVLYESPLNTWVRILDSFCNTLSLIIVEALICVQNWQIC